MAKSLKTVKAKIKKQVKLLEIVENESRKLFERKMKYELQKHLKHAEEKNGRRGEHSRNKDGDEGKGF